MATFEIPLSGVPESFLIALSGVQYKLTLQWRDAPQGGWVLDIADSLANKIVSGIPLTTGADLLEQYAYLGIGGELWVQTDGDPAEVPTFENLGSTSHLYFITD
ncbi:hypothetical protein AX768_25265 [Burkholderia sp. PAMC 28687]|uniref:phage baseplate plug family protein n=1 Tax=Burkholderia sp. PAMC 28687 TaxID=1795874 RepID=UPI000785FF0A|nr:hypothetical protein [Burkholderia sp. PAMC 28687]AMM17512.1 hypothetical protein AX768_25265 [Burkholderia sp. PAMC 28687]